LLIIHIAAFTLQYEKNPKKGSRSVTGNDEQMIVDQFALATAPGYLVAQKPVVSAFKLMFWLLIEPA